MTEPSTFAFLLTDVDEDRRVIDRCGTCYALLEAENTEAHLSWHSTVAQPPTTVRRVRTENGSRIEPPLDDEWSHLEKLRWQLAVVLHDADAPPDLLTIEEGYVTVNGRRIESFDLRYPHASRSAGDFYSAWTFLNGVGLGLELAKA